MSDPRESAPKSAARRVGFIDALRAWGAFYIVIVHVVYISKPPLEVPAWAAEIVKTGATAVSLFFLLSAFTLMLSARRRGTEGSALWEFYLRRFFRIAPLFYAWIAVMILRNSLSGSSYPWHTVLLNTVFCYNLIPGNPQGIVWAGWVISIEMTFYLFFPLIHRYVDNLWKSVGFIFLSVALSGIFSEAVARFFSLDPAAREDYLFFSFPRNLPVFAIGLTVFFIYEAFIQKRRRPLWWGLLCIIAAAIVYGAVLAHRIPGPLNYQFAVALAYGLLILGFSMAPVKILVNPLTRFLGEISYSTYLNHPTIVWAFAPIYLYVYTLPISTDLRFGIALFLTFGVVTVLSAGTHAFIEQPGIRLGRWIIRRIRQCRRVESGGSSSGNGRRPRSEGSLRRRESAGVDSELIHPIMSRNTLCRE